MNQKTTPKPATTTKPSETQATKAESALAVRDAKAGAVALAGDFSGMAGLGFENAGRDDLAIPFLVLLQSGSPQCKRSDGNYIEGAAEGMLLNSVTKQLMDPVKERIVIVPCAYQRSFVEWRTREAGGGFVMQHDVATGQQLLSTAERDEKGRDILPSANQLNDTRAFYVMVIGDDGTPSPAFISMTSTQIKKSKQWLMQQNLLKLKDGHGNTYTPPMFAAKWHVSTVAESNDKGSWFGWAFEFDSFFPGVDDPTFQAVLGFHKSIAKGEVKADLAKAGEVVGEAVAGDDDIPF